MWNPDADRDIPLRALLCECLRIEGKAVPRTLDNEAIKAAFSTVSLPGILGNVANRKLLQSYKAQPVIATRLCTEGDHRHQRLQRLYQFNGDHGAYYLHDLE